MSCNAYASTLPAPPMIDNEYPPCLCETSTPWPWRRLDRPWEHDRHIESRTCLECGATKSIARCNVVLHNSGHECRAVAPYFVVGLRADHEYHACERHATDLIRSIHCEVTDADGQLYVDGDDGLEKAT